MFPLGDENEGMRLKPFVLIGIILVNFAVWFYEVSLSRIELQNFMQDWAAIPATIMDGENLYTLVTNTFIHGSWGHILGNMLFLWIFGNNIENVMGHFRFLVFYLLAGIAGAGLFVLLNQDSTTVLVGASGAIAGVMGAYMRLYPHGRIRSVVFISFIPVEMLIPAWIWIGFWIATQFLMGYQALTSTALNSGGVAFSAHIGGAVVGLLLAKLFADDAYWEEQKAARAANSDYQKKGQWKPSLPWPFNRSDS